MSAGVGETTGQAYYCPLCHTRTTRHGAGTDIDPQVLAEHEEAPGIPCEWSGTKLVVA